MTWLRTVLLIVLAVGATSCTAAGSTDPSSGAEEAPSACPSPSLAPALPRDRVGAIEVRRTATAVVIEAHQQDVVDSPDQAWAFRVVTPVQAWTVEVHRFDAGEESATEAVLYPGEPPSPAPTDGGEHGCGGVYGMVTVDCPGAGAEVAPVADSVQVVVPWTCLRSPEWVRVGVTVEDSGHEPTYSSPALGPQVPVG
ncbi:hypothetical protein [Nocardioides sp. URHA0020]|uniref:hypothetical protein n=1 Tax=Nocardioides sp. URHA0020 TaxID=1380392 RepID=UPI000563D903|nr:hypothetical protein [Nocardioides sp. URHA0020]